MLEIMNNNYVKYGCVAAALIIGMGLKLYLGSANPIEMESEHIIDEIVTSQTGVDITPFLEPGKTE